MLLVDTNVVAYLLIAGDYTAAAQELRARDPDWRSEAFLLIEFTNVLASSIARKRMTLSMAEDFLAKVSSLFDGKLGRIPHASVLAIATRHRVSADDARNFISNRHRHIPPAFGPRPHATRRPQVSIFMQAIVSGARHCPQTVGD